MQFGRALVAAAQTHTLTGSYPAIVGTYPDGVIVHVRRSDEAGHLNTPFSVTIATGAATTAPVICDGMHLVRAFLVRHHLHSSTAEWTVQEAVPAANGGEL